MTNGDLGPILGGALVSGILATGPGGAAGAAGAGGGGTRPGGHERRGRMTMLQALTADSTFNAEWLATNIPGAANTHDAMTIMSRLPTAQFNAITSAMGTAAGEAGDLAALGAGVMVGANALGIPYDPVRIVSDRPYIEQLGAQVQISETSRREEGPAYNTWSAGLRTLIGSWDKVDWSDPINEITAGKGLDRFEQGIGKLGPEWQGPAGDFIETARGSLASQVVSGLEAFNLNAWNEDVNILATADPRHLGPVRPETVKADNALDILHQTGAGANVALMEEVFGAEGAALAKDLEDSGRSAFDWAREGATDDGRAAFLRSAPDKSKRAVSLHLKEGRTRDAKDKANRVAGLFKSFGFGVQVLPSHFTNDAEGYATIDKSFWADVQKSARGSAAKVTYANLDEFGAALDDAVASEAITLTERQELESLAARTIAGRYHSTASDLDGNIGIAIRGLFDGKGNDTFLAAMRGVDPEEWALRAATPSELLLTNKEIRERYEAEEPTVLGTVLRTVSGDPLAPVKALLGPKHSRQLSQLDLLATDRALREELLGGPGGGLLGLIERQGGLGYGGPFQPGKSDAVNRLAQRLGLTTWVIGGDRPDISELNTFIGLVQDYKERIGSGSGGKDRWAKFVETGKPFVPKVNVGAELSWGGDKVDNIIAEHEGLLLDAEVDIAKISSLPGSAGLEYATSRGEEVARGRKALGALKAQRDNSTRVNVLFGDFGFALTSGLDATTISEAVAGRMVGADPFVGTVKDAKGAELFKERVAAFGEGPGAFANMSNLSFNLIIGNADKLVAGTGEGTKGALGEAMQDQIGSLKNTIAHWATAVGEARKMPNWITHTGAYLGVSLPEELVIDAGTVSLAEGVRGKHTIETEKATNEDIAHWLMWRVLSERDPLAGRPPVGGPPPSAAPQP